MTTYRIASPRSRTDRAAEILWTALALPGRGGLTTQDMVLVDCVRLRARRIDADRKERIDRTLDDAGYTPLRWTEERPGGRR